MKRASFAEAEKVHIFEVDEVQTETSAAPLRTESPSTAITTRPESLPWLNEDGPTPPSGLGRDDQFSRARALSRCKSAMNAIFVGWLPQVRRALGARREVR